LLLEVNLYRQEVLINEVGNFWVGIDLGIQPSARASHGGGAEVQQYGTVLSFGFGERRIGIFGELHRHGNLLSSQFPVSGSSPGNWKLETGNRKLPS
jgi:hypothetical protein